MPLIRPNDTTQLSSAFTRFCSNLEDCIRRDGTADTEGFFASGNTSNFNNYASSFSADSIYADLNERLNTEDYSGFPNGVINNLSRRVSTGLLSPVLTNMKSTILCAFELTNRGQANRINKQQLYTFLFCLGFPVGLIAKIILNGNVGGVRNGVLTHKQFATALLVAIASGSRRDDLKKGFLGNENVGSIWEHRFFTICLLCQKVGGQNLFNKFVNCTDQKELAQSVYAPLDVTTFTKQLLCYGFTINDRVYRVNTINLFQRTFAEQRGQRRTGQTLSRNAVDTTNLSSSTALPSASNTPRNSEVRSSVSSEQSRPITTPTRSTATSPVRDEPLQETIGVEFEVVRPKEVSYREFVNSIVKKFRENGLDVQAEGYNHNTRNYWKLVPDASISAQQGDSLRGDSGIECVSPVLSGKKGIVDIKKAIRSLVGAGASINKSVGYHAHFGIGGLSIEHLRNLLYNYRGFEPIVDTIMLDNRRGAVNSSSESQWAKSLYRKYPNENDFWQLLESCQTISDIQSQVFRNDRYQKTNLMAYGRYGTIEFRQHGGTLEEDTIIYWLYWLHFLIQVSKRKKLSFFDFKQVRNITPVWLSTWMGNRAFDMSGRNFNAV
jgi:Ca2+-binding EF-hand superfamily protein